MTAIATKSRKTNERTREESERGRERKKLNVATRKYLLKFEAAVKRMFIAEVKYGKKKETKNGIVDPTLSQQLVVYTYTDTIFYYKKKAEKKNQNHLVW